MRLLALSLETKTDHVCVSCVRTAAGHIGRITALLTGPCSLENQT